MASRCNDRDTYTALVSKLRVGCGEATGPQAGLENEEHAEHRLQLGDATVPEGRGERHLVHQSDFGMAEEKDGHPGPLQAEIVNDYEPVRMCSETRQEERLTLVHFVVEGMEKVL